MRLTRQFDFIRLQQTYVISISPAVINLSINLNVHPSAYPVDMHVCKVCVCVNSVGCHVFCHYATDNVQILFIMLHNEYIS